LYNTATATTSSATSAWGHYGWWWSVGYSGAVAGGIIKHAVNYLGRDAVAAIEALSGHAVAASDDLTGGAPSGGDWILETGNIDAGAVYFEADALAAFTDVLPDMEAATEEIFGPVLSVIRVDSFEEAVRVANGTRYGLAASLFTDDLDRIYRFQRDIKSGMTHVNHGTVTDGSMPFGGVKDSGLGAFSKGKTNKDFYTTWKVNYVKFS